VNELIIAGAGVAGFYTGRIRQWFRDRSDRQVGEHLRKAHDAMQRSGAQHSRKNKQ
jgi:hypothetical protein